MINSIVYALQKNDTTNISKEQNSRFSYVIPSKLKLVPLNILSSSMMGEKRAKKLLHNAKKMQSKGYVEVTIDNFPHEIDLDDISMKLLLLKDKLFQRSVITVIKDNFPIKSFYGSSTTNAVSVEYYFSVNNNATIVFEEAYYLVFNDVLKFPLEMVNREVAGLPAMLLTMATSLNGKSMTSLMWADNSKLYKLTLYEQKRDPLLELNLLRSANALTSISD